MFNLKKRLSLPVSLFWIMGSALCISGTFYSIFHRNQFFAISQNDANIIAILQTGPQKEALSSSYLAELMELSIDQPKKLSQFDCKQAKEKLLESPLIKQADVKLIKPNTVFVDYATRKPIAKLYDYKNLAVDEEGYLFPLSPYFSPMRLSEIYLGMAPFNEKPKDQELPIGSFDMPLDGKFFALALEILKLIKEEKSFEDLFLHRIDVSNAFKESYGRREVVLLLESDKFSTNPDVKHPIKFSYLLRVFPKSILEGLENYLSLRQAVLNAKEDQEIEEKSLTQSPSPTVIDLRIDDLAFINPS